MTGDFIRLAESGQLVCLVRFPGYAVSTDGRIWTCRKHVGLGYGHGSKAVLKEDWREHPGRSRPTGHEAVYVFGKSRYVHSLVLEAFVGCRPRNMECCHANGDPSDNRLENLRWDTHKANGEDMVRHGTQKTPVGSLHGRSKLTESDIVDIFRMKQDGFLDSEIAKAKGVSRMNVYDVLRRNTWKHVRVLFRN